jgi:hypothetical protein
MGLLHVLLVAFVVINHSFIIDKLSPRYNIMNKTAENPEIPLEQLSFGDLMVEMLRLEIEIKDYDAETLIRWQRFHALDKRKKAIVKLIETNHVPK